MPRLAIVECNGDGLLSRNLVKDIPSSKVSVKTLEDIQGSMGLGNNIFDCFENFQLKISKLLASNRKSVQLTSAL